MPSQDIATLAELDDPDHHIGARSHGFRVTTAWRVAFAACTALATGTSIWVLGHAGHASQAPQVLDGSLPSSTPTATGPSGIELLLQRRGP